MSWTHSHEQSFTLPEHAAEQRRLHRHLIAQLRSTSATPASSSSESDTDDQRSESEMDLDNYYFLQVCINIDYILLNTWYITSCYKTCKLFIHNKEEICPKDLIWFRIILFYHCYFIF